MRRVFTALLLVVAAGAAARVDLSPQHYLDHVRHLASPEMRGRGTGTPELEKAAEYIARQFHAFGLQPVNGSYFQRFPVTMNAKLGSHNRLTFVHGSRRKALKSGDEFQPFNFSSGGKHAGQMVFAGYGITAKEYNYDDYAGLDVKDKIVVLLRHEPQQYDEKSVFSGKVYTEHSQFFSKAVNAKMHGARGVILVNDPASHAGDADQMEPFGKTAGPADARIPFVQVKAAAVDSWLEPMGKSLKALQEAIDKDLTTQSFALPADLTVEMHVDVAREVKTVRNVIGYLPGETAEHVIIGAHYDHLGLGEQFSMAPSMAGTPHPGADDNASGTAGVLELARWFSTQPKRKRGLLFMTFAGEELGLLGSGYYANNPLLPLGNAAAMINMDMIGRVREGKVYVGGVGTGTTFGGMIEEVRKGYDLNLDLSSNSGYGSSDHTSFTAKQVPVLFFFSGLHGDYHKPSDTPDKIDGKGRVKLLSLVAEAAGRIAGEGDRPAYVRVAAPTSGHGAGDTRPSRGGGSGYGPYFGSIPDFAEPPSGVRFADVRDGSPAALAGLKGGDILVEFGGLKIENLQDFTYALRQKKPGDEVEVKVLRGQETVTAKVVLTARK